MDILFMVLCATVVIGFLVFIHEGGHYLAARAFGVRVTEFMLGLPGPSVGFTRGGTRFGVTAVPLGGYAKVCGMEAGEFVHVIADAHIYDRHIPLIEELISREPLPAPKFWLNPEVKDFYEFTRDDVKLLDYETHEQIKNIPVAI